MSETITTEPPDEFVEWEKIYEEFISHPLNRLERLGTFVFSQQGKFYLPHTNLPSTFVRKKLKEEAYELSTNDYRTLAPVKGRHIFIFESKDKNIPADVVVNNVTRHGTSTSTYEHNLGTMSWGHACAYVLR